jgi:hypothetical protein
MFAAVVFGWCPQQQLLRTFELQPRVSAELSVEILERTLSPSSIGGTAQQSAIVIGSSPSLLMAAIDSDLADQKARGEANEIVAFDVPKRALRRLISKEADQMVGGSIQQAWATMLGFQIVSDLEPIEPKPPSSRNAGLFVLGFDTFDIQRVGNYQVGVEGR